MSDRAHSRFDLSEFVLGYLEEQGGIVAPPEFGVHDAVLPEELARRLKLDDYQRLAFGEPALGQAGGDVLVVGVNHPMVEAIAQVAVAQPANARAYVNHVRLDKRGLAELARKSLGLANARVDAVPNSQEEAALHHYLRCNFKVSLVSEEKQEELVAVVMDVQAGHPVTDAATLARLELVEGEPAYVHFPVAAPRWRGAGPGVSTETLQALLPRAEAAVRHEMAGQVAALVARMERHLALDLARIDDYYDHLAADLRRRRDRLDEGDSARIQAADDKLASLQAERAAKLEDVRTRYPVRVEMELVNVLLVVQPKVILPVAISNRTASITRTVVWDPLMHRLEPLVCDVCGQPGDSLHLCTGGHLAHAGCLAPQCVDCKRAFCQLCADQLTTCVVCQRPVCRPSLIICPTCGRGTCHEHQQLCHAAEGAPASLLEKEASPTSKTGRAGKQVPAMEQPAAQPSAKAAAGVPAARGRSPAAGKPKPSSQPAAPKPDKPVTKAVRIDVQISETVPAIVVFAMRSTNRVWAARSIELTASGILVQCKCEKSPCPANGYYHRPQTAIIDQQVEKLMRAVQQEYWVPAKKVSYFYTDGEEVREAKRFTLPPMWHDPARLADAVRGFDEMVKR